MKGRVGAVGRLAGQLRAAGAGQQAVRGPLPSVHRSRSLLRAVPLPGNALAGLSGRGAGPGQGRRAGRGRLQSIQIYSTASLLLFINVWMVAKTVTAFVSQWDETICDMAVCQHPQCWDTIRRIEQGHPRVRLRDFDSLCRISSESEDELPTLKIMNFPSNWSPQRRIRCSNCNRTISTFTALETSFSPLYETSVCDFSDSNSEVSSARTHFPGLNSVVESRMIPQREINFTFLNKVGNLQVVDLSQAAAPKREYWPDSGNLIVKWVPNIHRKSQRPKVQAVTELKPLRRVCVKDLVSENLSSLKELQNKRGNLDPKRKKSKKVPSGGQPYQLRTKRSQKINWMTKKIKSVSSHRGDSSAAKEGKVNTSQIKERRSSPRQLQTAAIVELQNKDALHLRNLRGNIPEATEKHLHPLLVQKIPVMSLKEQGLERISNRPYLRKPFEGSLGLRGHVTKLEQKLGYSEAGPFVLTTQSLESCMLDGTEEASATKNQLSLKPPAELELQAHEGPRKQHVGLGKRRLLGMYVPYRTSTASLVREGVGENGHLPPHPESQYEMYCKHLASRKEAAQALGYRQGGSSWLQPSPAAPTPESDKQEDDSYPNPPPPPPSPSTLRNDGILSTDTESPLFREDSTQRLSIEQGHRSV
ncbi:uncharacterized protein C9orf43 homolog [Carettochelys insculpta]|uniref:uncharacterized protein C9orf43 homolog n=1 Tax=Carettochelys insculpta TaxID=44489 RepID=UPI003EBAD366